LSTAPVGKAASADFQLVEGSKGKVIARVPPLSSATWAGGAFSPDNQLLAVALNLKQALPTGRPELCANAVMARLTPQDLKAAQERGKRLRREYKQLPKIMLCDPRTGKELARFGKVGVSVLAFSPDGRYLAASGHGQLFFDGDEDKEKKAQASAIR